MDNAQKAIMLGVGLFITIIVIAAVMAITGIGQQLIGQGQTQLSGISGQLAAQLRSDYDNQSISGTQARTIVNKFYNDNTIAVYLATPAEGFVGIGAINEANEGGSTKYYRASAAKLNLETSSSFKLALSDGTNVDGFTGGRTDFNQNRKIQSVTVNNCLLESATNATSMSSVNAAITTNSMYKTALITNEDTGSIVGLVVIRYQ